MVNIQLSHWYIKAPYKMTSLGRAKDCALGFFNFTGLEEKTEKETGRELTLKQEKARRLSTLSKKKKRWRADKLTRMRIEN